MVIYFHQRCRVTSRIDWRGRTLWKYQRLPLGSNAKWIDCKGGELTTRQLEKSLGPTGNPHDRSFSRLQEVGFHL